jgi:Protein of unknown function (DUF3237)
MSEANAFASQASTLTEPRLEFVMEVRLWFARVQTIANMPTGAGRGAVYVDRGEFAGPRLRGKAVPVYMLEEDDGTLILLRNRGFLWGRKPDTMQRLRAMIFEGGAAVDPSEYYLRAAPSFEVQAGKHDWLTRHVFVGVGERKPDGNLIRYYALL